MITPLDILIMEIGNGQTAQRTLNALEQVGYRIIRDEYKNDEQQSTKDGEIGHSDLLR